MALYETTWTTGTSIRSAESLGNGSNVSDPHDLKTLKFYEIALQVTFDIASGSPNGDLLIELFGSADDGVSVDTEPFLTRRLNFTATGNKKRTIRGIGGPHVTSKCTNNTGVTGTITIKRAGVKQSST